jgi:hypothetical protein
MFVQATWYFVVQFNQQYIKFVKNMNLLQDCRIKQEMKNSVYGILRTCRHQNQQFNMFVEPAMQADDLIE